MKLHVLSDLHVEHADWVPPKTDAGVVVLAGDIHRGRRAIPWARKVFPRSEVVQVAGNHEFYRQREGWEGLIDEMRADARAHDVHFLEDDSCIIGNVRFVGASLWVDFDYFGEDTRAEAMRASKEYLADFSQVFMRTRSSNPPEPNSPEAPLHDFLLSPRAVRERHLRSRAWLDGELNKAHPGPTVVITHHMPSERSVASRFRDELANSGFTSRLDGMMGRSALWIHGHTHDSFDYELRGTRVICNPRGYCRRDGNGCENPNFNAGLVVEV